MVALPVRRAALLRVEILMGKKAEYGRGRPAFLEYVKFIAEHPNYAGMPDTHSENGEVQWETPSNRSAGKFKDSHLKRLHWWKQTARTIGIDPDKEEKWISRTAKAIHPTKEKPCKNCGRILDIRYLYPSGPLTKRIVKLPYYDPEFPLDPTEKVTDLVARLVEQFGDKVFRDLPTLFATSEINIPKLSPTLEAWCTWLLESYVPREPRTLSPGVMANPPDRFDGFHSFNRCCRAKADKGRSKENLQSYSTDRRVFEYWVDGDWVAADRLMGLIRSDAKLKAEACQNGHSGPCAADHIGPISLGFSHRPQFRLLCNACNSAKNNRMTLQDVVDLRGAEARGELVTSWYCQRLWDIRKASVTTDETAGRLSKMLRDNRHTVMFMLDKIARNGHFGFLASFLGLEHANEEPEFKGLRVQDHITVFDKLITGKRETKYAVEQKARRFRIAFSALADYASKSNRNSFIIATPEIRAEYAKTLAALRSADREVMKLDEDIATIFRAEVPSDTELRTLMDRIPETKYLPQAYIEAKKHLTKIMDLVAGELSSQWDESRYLRADTTDDGD